MMKRYILFLSLCCLFACKSPSYLPQPKDYKNHVKGSYIKVKLVKEYKNIFGKTLGEVIAVKPEEIQVLTLEEQKIITIAKADIAKAEIVIASTSNNPEAISTAAGLSMLFPLGHGLFMIFTGPITLTTTSSVGNGASKGRYSVRYPQNISWDQMKKFARFPQGLPKNIDINEIK